MVAHALEQTPAIMRGLHFVDDNINNAGKRLVCLTEQPESAQTFPVLREQKEHISLGNTPGLVVEIMHEEIDGIPDKTPTIPCRGYVQHPALVQCPISVLVNVH